MGTGLHHVVCNGAQFALSGKDESELRLEYRAGQNPNIRIGLPSFVDQLTHVPARLLDLLELAAYVYCADRWTDRGAKDAVEYHGWSRAFHFHVKVRDFAFWSQSSIGNKLNAVLSFLSGDREFNFEFEAGHDTPPASLFDIAGVSLSDLSNTRVVLFSGGLDSLSGAYDILQRTPDRLCLVSHRSSQPQIGHTQDRLVEALRLKFPKRVEHYKFHCNLTGHRAAEETQRTRMFLYASIAVAIAAAGGVNQISIFENGITSLNFARRQDLLNARSTRTTHPKIICLLQELFRDVASNEFTISTPFFWNTKADVVAQLARNSGADLIPSAVSCSRTFLPIGSASHCGECSQCVDRRFACYAAGLEEIDDGVPYARNFITQPMSQGEARTTIVDYVRQANNFATWNTDHFVTELLGPLAEAVEYVGAVNDEESNNRIADLCRRHGKQVMNAVARMRAKHDRLEEKLAEGSLLSLIAGREYLKPPVLRLLEAVCKRLSAAIPIAFQRNAPKDEPDLNDKISSILNTDSAVFDREHPAVRFGLATAIPDHSAANEDLVIETKYLRDSTTPSRASEGMAADLIKYPSGTHILFVVYDPNRSISDDETFCRAFEEKGNCTVHIIR
jgi:7-cyano-7-deazaguanine synthase in queuosine biosynthesis